MTFDINKPLQTNCGKKVKLVFSRGNHIDACRKLVVIGDENTAIWVNDKGECAAGTPLCYGEDDDSCNMKIWHSYSIVNIPEPAKKIDKINILEGLDCFEGNSNFIPILQLRDQINLIAKAVNQLIEERK